MRTDLARRADVYSSRVDEARRRGLSIFDPSLGSPERETCRRCGSTETYRREALVKGYRVNRLRCRACDRADHRKRNPSRVEEARV